jgi:hypothetical protein
MKKFILIALLSLTSCATYKIRVIHRNDGVKVYVPMQRRGLTWKDHWYSYFTLAESQRLIDAWRIKYQKQKEQYIKIR